MSSQKMDEAQLSLVFQAISDQTRRALLTRLTQGGPAMITQLAEPFDMSLPAVSKHLRVLERAQLVERSVQGRVHTFSVTPNALQSVEQWLNHYRSFWTENLDRLEAFAEVSGRTSGKSTRRGRKY